VSTNSGTSSTNHSNPRSHPNRLGICSSASPKIDYNLLAREASAHSEAGSLSYPSISDAEASQAFGLPYCHSAQNIYGDPAPFDESGAVHNYWTLPPGNAFTDSNPANCGPITFPRNPLEAYPYRSGVLGEFSHDTASDMDNFFEASPIFSGTTTTPGSHGDNAAFQGITWKSIDPRMLPLTVVF